MNETLLTVMQALQLAALGPSLFLAVFLLLTVKEFRRSVVPAAYFLALSCSFLLPLLSIWEADGPKPVLAGALMLGESLTPSLSFLLIMQFLLARTPPFFYWLILALPLVGGSSLIYSTFLMEDDVCAHEVFCLSSESIRTLYDTFSAAIIFALLLALFHRQMPKIDEKDGQRRHKYWIIVMLILFNLAAFALDLAELASHISHADRLLAVTSLRIAFIYLVLVSIFRVFDRQFELDIERVPHAKVLTVTEEDQQLAEQLRKLLEEDHIYREMALSREQLAKRMGTSEHQLSKVMNRCFEKSFPRLMNYYRIREAKQRLQIEQAAVTVIAFEVGFNSLPTFNRAFKEEVGFSPTEWREGKR